MFIHMDSADIPSGQAEQARGDKTSFFQGNERAIVSQAKRFLPYVSDRFWTRNIGRRSGEVPLVTCRVLSLNPEP